MIILQVILFPSVVEQHMTGPICRADSQLLSPESPAAVRSYGCRLDWLPCPFLLINIRGVQGATGEDCWVPGAALLSGLWPFLGLRVHHPPVPVKVGQSRERRGADVGHSRSQASYQGQHWGYWQAIGRGHRWRDGTRHSGESDMTTHLLVGGQLHSWGCSGSWAEVVEFRCPVQVRNPLHAQTNGNVGLPQLFGLLLVQGLQLRHLFLQLCSPIVNLDAISIQLVCMLLTWFHSGVAYLLHCPPIAIVTQNSSKDLDSGCDTTVYMIINTIPTGIHTWLHILVWQISIPDCISWQTGKHTCKYVIHRY